MSIARYATAAPVHVPADDRADHAVLTFFRGVWAGMCFLARHPVLVTVTALSTWAGSAYGWLAALGVVSGVGGLLMVWAGLSWPSFDRLLWSPANACLQRWTVYAVHWDAVMAATGLTVTRGQAEPLVPRLLHKARYDTYAARLRVDLVPGLGPEDFEREADNLAHCFGARTCTVRTLQPGRIELSFATTDPLATPVAALPIPEFVDLHAVPVGIRDDGQPWTLPALGTHLLIAGATGAGKGSALWSLLRGVAPEIARGRVQALGIDPKGGMELCFGRELFSRLAADSVEQMTELLEDAVAVMNARTARLAGHSRLHVPTVDEPLMLVVIDELATLTAYQRDRDLKKRIDAALQNLLTKGRAPGVTVIGALQDPRKEVLAYRDLFPHRVALRLVEREQVGMVLGDAAWDRGAKCERIPHALPGVGYVQVEDQREPIRVRAGHVTDADLRAMCARYPTPGLAAAAAAPTTPAESTVVDLRDTRTRATAA